MWHIFELFGNPFIFSTRSFSRNLVSMTIMGTFCSHIILQKSSTVLSMGPCAAMNSLLDEKPYKQAGEAGVTHQSNTHIYMIPRQITAAYCCRNINNQSAKGKKKFKSVIIFVILVFKARRNYVHQTGNKNENMQSKYFALQTIL